MLSWIQTGTGILLLVLPINDADKLKYVKFSFSVTYKEKGSVTK